VAKPDDMLLVICRSGGRSAMAINALAKAGFKNVYNIIEGMEGCDEGVCCEAIRTSRDRS
jgi:rhodanese-related sulfurtransferase